VGQKGEREGSLTKSSLKPVYDGSAVSTIGNRGGRKKKIYRYAKILERKGKGSLVPPMGKAMADPP